MRFPFKNILIAFTKIADIFAPDTEVIYIHTFYCFFTQLFTVQIFCGLFCKHNNNFADIFLNRRCVCEGEREREGGAYVNCQMD